MEDFLNGFYDKAIQYDHPQQIQQIQFNGLEKDYFKSQLGVIDQMNEHDLAILICNYIQDICRDILNNDKAYNGALVNTAFIKAFIRAINSIPHTYQVQLCCNKVCYDYFTSDNPDREIKGLYLNLAKNVNSKAIASLIAVGLDQTTAANLALCRYSSISEKVNVKRLNFTICNKPPEMMTEQTIIFIYECLFDRVSDLFQAIMFETYSTQEQNDFGDDFVEVYGTIGLAILTILNNMTSENISKVLVGYSTEWEYAGRPPVRFSLKNMSSDFLKITRVVEYLEKQGIVIP